jgi:hypothetical protein
MDECKISISRAFTEVVYNLFVVNKNVMLLEVLMDNFRHDFVIFFVVAVPIEELPSY